MKCEHSNASHVRDGDSPGSKPRHFQRANVLKEHCGAELDDSVQSLFERSLEMEDFAPDKKPDEREVREER